MAVEREANLEKQLRDEVKARGGLCIKLISTLFKGLPDRMCLMPGGRVIFVEVKTTGKKPRRAQEIVHTKFKKRGFPVHILDRTEQIKHILR